ncbi:MAG: hypothetical protein KBS91_02095 [Firmicutes bacterium]|nr:hypothetical protein [Candidatus Caballimonas caccae]
MDKLDIFKLLTSAYDFYQNKKEKKEVENSPTDFLSKILKPQENNPMVPEKKESPKEIKVAPLQEKMLGVMRSHDAFVNRVINNNKK